jgi:hypothetical protein
MMSTSSERKRISYYIPGEVIEFIKTPAYAMGIEITAFMKKHSIPSFVKPTVMQGRGLTLTWDWYVPIPETQSSAHFIPALCECGHMKRDHSDEFSGACTVSINGPIDCPCAGFK